MVPLKVPTGFLAAGVGSTLPAVAGRRIASGDSPGVHSDPASASAWREPPNPLHCDPLTLWWWEPPRAAPKGAHSGRQGGQRAQGCHPLAAGVSHCPVAPVVDSSPGQDRPGDGKCGVRFFSASAKKGDMPERGPYCPFTAPQISRVQSIVRAPVLLALPLSPPVATVPKIGTLPYTALSRGWSRWWRTKKIMGCEPGSVHRPERQQNL